MIKIVQIEKEEKEKMKRKAVAVKDISTTSAKIALEDKSAYGIASAMAIVEGFRTRSFKAGTIAGVLTFGGIIGANVIGDLIDNIEDIKKA